MAKKIKSPVTIRTRKGKKGESIYLDIYINGKREYEYLNLYLSEGKTKEEKILNDKCMKIAQEIRSKREIEIIEGTFGKKKDNDFMQYYKDNKGKAKYYATCENHLKAFLAGKNVSISSFDVELLDSFYKYLLTKVKGSSAAIYIQAILFVLNKAEKHGYKTNKKGFRVPAAKSAERNYLTIEEIRPIYKKYSKSNKKGDHLIKAFLFSCLTGMRLSDVKKLAWKDIRKEGDYYRVFFEQKKTSQQEYLDINPQAYELLGNREDIAEDKPIFKMNVDARSGHKLRESLAEFGITKHISFHCARHSFAIMMLELDTDIYTVSKLLGHTNIATTQIYAKVVDKKKRQAIDRIPKLI